MSDSQDSQRITNVASFVSLIRKDWSVAEKSFNVDLLEYDESYKSTIMEQLERELPHGTDAKKYLLQNPLNLAATIPWFRGLSDDYPLLPKLYREQVFPDPRMEHSTNAVVASYSELNLIQRYRLRARLYPGAPHRDDIDEWLFLMQHTGLPTRLLDWSEGALIALFFAIRYSMTSFKDNEIVVRVGANLSVHKPVPVVWMLHPHALNLKAIGKPLIPLTWVNEGLPPFQHAFGDGDGYEFPVAVYPPTTHPRMAGQRSCFTIHGRNKSPLEEIGSDLLVKGYLKKYEFDPLHAPGLLKELRILGISASSLFPDFDGLSEELSTFL